jgi:hypothetical protein
MRLVTKNYLGEPTIIDLTLGHRGHLRIRSCVAALAVVYRPDATLAGQVIRGRVRSSLVHWRGKF